MNRESQIANPESRIPDRIPDPRSPIPILELFGSASCQYTSELREQLLWEGREFVEYDVERDPDARQRLFALTGGARLIPVLVENDRVLQSGWRGRGCTVSP